MIESNAAREASRERCMSVVDQFDFEGLEALRVGRFKMGVSSSCIVYRFGETVIDTGPPNQWRHVRHFLAEREIKQVLITHHHEDHGGNGGRIQKKWGPNIFTHEKGLALHGGGFPMPFYRRLIFGAPKRFQPAVLPEMIQAGELKLTPIHCPGHAPDLVCFYEAKRGWLFTGDIYITASPRMLRGPEDPNQEIESLTNLLNYQFDTLLCSHRGVVLNGYEQIRKKQKYLIAVREQVHYYTARGETVGEICLRILGKEELQRWVTLGDFSKQNFIRAFVEAKRKADKEIRTANALDVY